MQTQCDISMDKSFIQLQQKMPYAHHAFGTKNGAGETLHDTLRFYTEKLGPVAHMRQVHADRISYASLPGIYEECDGIYTDHSDLWLAVKTADCVPVLISSPSAVAALHCGWRGLKAGLLPKMINTLMEEFQLSPTEMFVAIGPHISQPYYEVDESFANEFEEKFFRPAAKAGKLMMDLGGIARAQAQNMGINDLNIFMSNHCTFKESDIFHSHRWAKKHNNTTHGVQLSLISRVAEQR